MDDELITAYIGLGSNLSNPAEQITTAITAIQQDASITLLRQSPLYRTVAMGPEQPDYANAVIAIATSYSASELLRCLQQIELAQGRIRSAERWSARTIDLDILLYGKETIQTSSLTVPHYDMTRRNFVLIPLLDIAAEITMPDGVVVKQLPAANSRTGIALWHE